MRKKKQVDSRIQSFIDNGVKLRHRSMFVIVGDKPYDQIMTFYGMLSKSVLKWHPTVLWCYNDKLGLSRRKKKRIERTKKLMQKGLLDPDKTDDFSLFIVSANITYCVYKDAATVLDNTFGMCILQDFEALTPDVLVRTIDTVESGGLVILLLRSLSFITTHYTVTMDVHARFRTAAHSQAVSRFNERFLLSIASCKATLIVDDELNVLPLSSHLGSIQPVAVAEDSEGLSEKERDLRNFKEQFHDKLSAGHLIDKCCTLDQAKAINTFLDVLHKTPRSTVALIAARGRGKSAALGLAIAGAIGEGYSNIFVTAPSPGNLKTLFEFVCTGLNSLEYKEHLHYVVLKSGDPDMKKVTIQINVFKQHRQTIQYFKPQDHKELSQVELLVIDQAAAIPLSTVKSLLGPYFVFLASSINGYEGTSRSLSLKLLQHFESQGQMSSQNLESPHLGRLFKKVELHESVRYASSDPIEAWLNGLLCLDVASYIPNIGRLPNHKECELYYVNRDILFSYHKETEIFLQRMMALYVASHYKNSRNDLQLISDAPSHQLFVLLGPVDESQNQYPDILCVIQVCLEGEISRKLCKDQSSFDDEIRWKFCEQFQDSVFQSLSGARILRIAVHPSALRLGYGSAAVDLLIRYYQGQLSQYFAEKDDEEIEDPEIRVIEVAEKVSSLEETKNPRANLPPLLVHLRVRHPEKLHYIGVSFGLTRDLFRFWRKHNFIPFCIDQEQNAATGEHSCIALRPLDNDEIENDGSSKYGFLKPFYQDFCKRFSRLLDITYRNLDCELAMSILDSKINFTEQERASIEANLQSSQNLLSPFDTKRLEAYTNNCVDYHVILDLVPDLAFQYFQGELPLTLSPAEASVLFCIGMQSQDVTSIKEKMNLESEQILSILREVMKKLYNYLYSITSKEIDATLPRLGEVTMAPHSTSVDEHLDEAAKQAKEKMKAENEGFLSAGLGQPCAIVDKEGEFEKSLQSGAGKASSSGLVSVKSSRSKMDIGLHKKKRKDKNDGERSNPKRERN